MIVPYLHNTIFTKHFRIKNQVQMRYKVIYYDTHRNIYEKHVRTGGLKFWHY